MTDNIIKVEEAAIRILKSVFAGRIAEESETINLQQYSKSLRIKSLELKVINFISKNPISNFEILFPNKKTSKTVNLKMSNFSEDDFDNISPNDITMIISNDWEECKVYFTPLLGKSNPIVTLMSNRDDNS